MQLRTVVVDDERKSRELLELLLSRFCPTVKIVGSCATVREAIYQIKEKQPDLVLLDVEMPDGSGFSLFESKDIIYNFEVIFTTAFSQYAIDAFKVSAADYLLKPMTKDNLVKAINKVANKLEGASEREYNTELLKQIKKMRDYGRLGIPSISGVNFIEIKNIIRCEADSNYTIVYMENREKMIISRTLRDLEVALSPYDFYRIHKSHIICLRKISSYQKGENCMVTMTDGSQLPVSKQMKEVLEEHLNML